MWTAEQIGPLLPNVSTWPQGWDTTDPEERLEAAVWLAETFNRINSTMTPDKGGQP